MKSSFVSYVPLPGSCFSSTLKRNKIPASIELEITSRCNNNCVHCFINTPLQDKEAQKKELTFKEITCECDEALRLGALWCLVTGGEPLVRPDFPEIYCYLKKKGFLVSVFTNATLINAEHIRLFKKYPPRDIEVTVYGATKETYEAISRTPGSFALFKQGLELLYKSGVKVRLKAMVLRSNAHELRKIFKFCRQRTKDFFRFDPFLHFRYDGDTKRNKEIKAQRLSLEEIISIERQDRKRFSALEKQCAELSGASFSYSDCRHLFHCGAGERMFTIGHDGFFRLCSCLVHPACIYDLRKGTLSAAWNEFVPKIRALKTDKEAYLKTCHICTLRNICFSCPAKAHLESGALDEPIEDFCKIAHARKDMVT